MNEVIVVNPKDIIREGVTDSSLSKFNEIEDEIVNFDMKIFFEDYASSLCCKIVLYFQNGKSEIIEDRISTTEDNRDIDFFKRIVDKLKFKNPKNSHIKSNIQRNIFRATNKSTIYGRF